VLLNPACFRQARPTQTRRTEGGPAQSPFSDRINCQQSPRLSRQVLHLGGQGVAEAGLHDACLRSLGQHRAVSNSRPPALHAPGRVRRMGVLFNGATVRRNRPTGRPSRAIATGAKARRHLVAHAGGTEPAASRRLPAQQRCSHPALVGAARQGSAVFSAVAASHREPLPSDAERGECLLIIPCAHRYLHGARLNMSPLSRTGFMLIRGLLPRHNLAPHRTSGPVFKNLYRVMRREESVVLSLRLLTHTSMELDSTCHLCRSRASYSAGPLHPRHNLDPHRTSGPLFKNLYRVMRREESIFSSSRALNDTSMELASTCHLCRARASC